MPEAPVAVPAQRHLQSGRATRNMDRLAIRREGNDLYVDLSHIIKSDTDRPAWDAATITV